MAKHASAERALQFERLALDWAERVDQDGDFTAAALAQSFATLAVAARLDHLQRRLSVVGDQLSATKKDLGRLTREPPER